MKRPVLPFLVCSAVLAGFPVFPAGAAPEMLQPVYREWTTWLNPQFDAAVPVPPGLRAQNDPRRGSSCRFVSGDGAFILKSWANPLAAGSRDPGEAAWREAINLGGRRIDFQRRSPEGFILAGMTGSGLEFYEKVIFGERATAGINLAWPVQRNGEYAAWVEEIAAGFSWQTPAENSAPPPRRFEPEPAPARRDAVPEVDLTPPPLPPEKTVPPAPLPPEEKTSVKPAPAKREDLPYGIPIPGKKGYVLSPFVENKQQVDVTDIPTGTKVKCPYTGKVFRVP